MKIGFWETAGDEEKDFFLKSLPEHQLSFFENPLSGQSLPDEKDKDFDIISVFVGSKIDGKVISAFPNLKHISTRSTGFDHIDVEAVKSKNISVSNVPGYGAKTVAEFTIGLIIALLRKIPHAVQRLKVSGDFTFEGLRGFDLNGKTLGIIGTGRIGLNTAKIASGFDMQVLAYDTRPKEDCGIKYVSLDELLKNSDIVTIHVPYTKETHHLINKEKIALMKKGAFLVNTSRGGLIDTEALYQALISEKLAGAGLDVLEEEGDLKEEAELLGGGRMNSSEYKTVLEDHVLIHHPNVIITPHMAFYTKEAEFSIRETAAKNISSAILGKPENLVT